MGSTRSILLVSHTHWDREWYLTQEQFRVRLVALIDLVLEMLERDPAFPYFMLDGQTIVLDDYLAVRPEARARIERLVSAGRLWIGPWFVLPDEWLVSGESLIRNLRRGLRDARSFGGAMRVGYVPDQFGHVGQLPQLFLGFGFEGAALWRGVGAEITDSCFVWEAPDGSRIDTLYLATGYANAAHLPLRPDALAERLQREIDRLAPFARERPVLLMNGVDHMLPEPGLPAALDAVRARFGDAEIEFSTLPGALDRVRGVTGASLPVHRGELRSGLRTPLLPGCASTRIPQKQREVRAEARLVRVLEPLSAWLEARGGRADRGLIDLAWRHLLENHPHDSICGCSVDRVHAQMESRFDRVEEITEAEIARVARELGAGLPSLPRAPARVASDALLVWNPHREGVCGIDGEVETGAPVPSRAGAQVSMHLRDHAGRRIPADVDVIEPGFCWENTSPIALARALVPDQGRELVGYFVDELVWRREGTTLVVDARLDGMPRREFAFQAMRQALVDALADPELTHATIRGSRSARVRLRAAVELPGWGLSELQLCAGRAGAAAAGRSGAAPSARHDDDGGRTLENDAWRVRVRPTGEFDLVHRASGARIEDALRFGSEGDRGDSYDFDPVPGGERSQTLRAVRVSVRAGEASAECIVRARLSVPASLAADRRSRSATRVSLPVTLRVRLPRGLDRLEIDAAVDNRARDHRLRLHVRAPWRAHRLRVASAFEHVERPIEPKADAFGSRFTAELPSGAGPQRGYAMLDDGTTQLTLANRGAPEIEAVHESDRSSSLAVTMLRAVGWLSRGDLVSRPLPAGPVFETPDAQAKGHHEVSLALRLDPIDAVTALVEADRFSVPPCALTHGAPAAGGRAEPASPDPAHELRLLELDRPEVLVSAIEPAAEHCTMVRLWNAGATRQTVRVQWLAAPDRTITPVRLDGEVARDVGWEPASDGAGRLTLRAGQIATLRIAPR